MVGWVTFVVRDWRSVTSDTHYTFLAVVVSSPKATPYLAASTFRFSLFLGWVLLPVHFFGGVVFVFLLCTKQCVFFAVGLIKKKQMGDLFCHFELNDNVVHPLFREVTANGKSTWKWLGGERSVQHGVHAVAIREEIIDCFNGCAIKSVDTFLKSKPWENLPFYECGDCTDPDVMIADDGGGVVPLKRTNTEPMYGTVQYEAFMASGVIRFLPGCLGCITFARTEGFTHAFVNLLLCSSLANTKHDVQNTIKSIKSDVATCVDHLARCIHEMSTIMEPWSGFRSNDLTFM